MDLYKLMITSLPDDADKGAVVDWIGGVNLVEEFIDESITLVIRHATPHILVCGSFSNTDAEKWKATWIIGRAEYVIWHGIVCGEVEKSMRDLFLRCEMCDVHTDITYQ